MLLNPLPGATQAERIVAIENMAPDGEPITTSYLDFRDFRDNLKLLNLVTARVGGKCVFCGRCPANHPSLG